jgi:uracil-DNA glycosylase
VGCDLVIVAQDFSDYRTYVDANTGWPGETVETNTKLVELVGEAGFPISQPQTGRSEDRIFMTNAVLCLKQNGMSGTVPSGCFRTCGHQFLRPLLEIIRPRAVAKLGVGALAATLSAYDLSRPDRLIRLLQSEWTIDLPSGSRLFPMAHPSRKVLNRFSSLELQKDDWRRLGDYLRAVRARDTG